MERLTNAATLLLACCALVVTVILVRQQTSPPAAGASAAMLAPVAQPDWREYASAGHVLGPQGAKVTVVEFADFECPVCRRFALYTDSLWTLGEDFNVIYRHFPLRGHRFALPAAKASECAGDQGRFAEMHRTLFTFPDSLGLASWRWYARTAGVADIGAFERCIMRAHPVPTIERDSAAGLKLRVRGTPTLLVGGIRVEGLPSFDSLRAYISRAGASSTGKQR